MSNTITGRSGGSNFGAAAVLAAGFALAAMIGVWGAMQVKQSDQTIVVTGSAKKRIVSDKVVWRAGVSYQATDLAGAYQALSANVPRVKAYLVKRGVPESAIKVSSIQSSTLTAKGANGEDTGRISGYSLRQTIEVKSDDVAKIEEISRQSTELINQGILLESNPPEYLYTKLADVKQQMLAEAAKDAKERADKIAASVGSQIGGVRSARMGVIQITPADSNDVSDSGMSDTSSLEKDITSVVSITFAVH